MGEVYTRGRAGSGLYRYQLWATQIESWDTTKRAIALAYVAISRLVVQRSLKTNRFPAMALQLAVHGS